MSRSTQYIGLNNKATTWLAKYRISGSSVNSYVMTKGLADEPIVGKIYKVAMGSFESLIAKEVVQFTVFSSGPMIFTHLCIFDDDELVGDIGDWKEDSNVKDEVDYINGTYHV